jgi:hypothetical protein
MITSPYSKAILLPYENDGMQIIFYGNAKETNSVLGSFKKFGYDEERI